jgi:hypothetical protein
VLYISGDKDGAKQTQRTFMNECPVVSQVKSYRQWKGGDQLGAMITQAKFFNATKENVVCVLNGTPVIGHAKAMAHYVMGNQEEGHRALKAASRTTGVITGGTIGMVVGGPKLAVAGGIAGGVAVDNLATKMESAIANEYRPNGIFYIKDRFDKKELTTGEAFDAVTSVAMDGLCGYMAGSSKQSCKKTELIEAPKETSRVKGFTDKRGRYHTVSKARRPQVKLESSLTKVSTPAKTQCANSKITDAIMLMNSREPLGKPDGEDEDMKVLRLLNDVKKL